MKVLVLCHGNMCRSPVAGEILRVSGVGEVRSRGFKISAGRAAKKVRDALTKYGYDLEDHVPQPVLAEDLEWAELILYMDEGNRKRLGGKATPEQYERARCLGSYVGVHKVPDPNFMPRDSLPFTEAIELLVNASRACARTIRAQRALD